jgi:hypothetical protein
MGEVGRWLVLAGLLLVIAGVLVQIGALSWFGRLPGDLRIQRPGFSFYFPVTSMLVLSALISLVGYLVRRFL